MSLEMGTRHLDPGLFQPDLVWAAVAFRGIPLQQQLGFFVCGELLLLAAPPFHSVFNTEGAVWHWRRRKWTSLAGARKEDRVVEDGPLVMCPF